MAATVDGTYATETAKLGAVVIYVPVYIPVMPHRCSHCGHECTGPPQVAGHAPLQAGAPFSRGGLNEEPLAPWPEEYPPGLKPVPPTTDSQKHFGDALNPIGLDAATPGAFATLLC